MTTIAAMRAGDKVFMAYDEQLTDEHGRASYDAQKVFQRGHLLIGVAGDSRALTTLPWLPPGKLKYESEPKRFMALTFPRIIEEFDTQHSLLLDEYELLVGTKGQLFHYESVNGGVTPLGQYDAIGTGAQFVLGSLATSERSVSATNRLRKALEVAKRFDSNSGGETGVMSL